MRNKKTTAPRDPWVPRGPIVPRGTTVRGRRVTVSTTGYDQDLQGVGGGPVKRPLTTITTGIRVPLTLPSSGDRYLFLLAFYSLQAGMRARLVNLRQLVTIGLHVTSTDPAGQYLYEVPIESPMWRFANGNVSWHLTMVPGGRAQEMDTWSNLSEQGQQFQYGTSPALLFQTAPDSGDGYSAPNGGSPWGVAIPGLETLAKFHDLRFPWQNAPSYGALDAMIEGPCDILFSASVLQTDPTSRPKLVIPSPAPVGATNYLQKEDATLAAFPTLQYQRIAGAFDLELEARQPLRLPEEFDPCAKRGLP